jgi:hypothetical protein
MAFHAEIIGASLHTNRATHAAAAAIIARCVFALMDVGRQWRDPPAAWFQSPRGQVCTETANDTVGLRIRLEHMAEQ